MSQHYQALTDTKQHYGEIFQSVRTAIEAQLEMLKSGFECPTCPHPPLSFAEKLHADCGYRAWQQAGVHYLEMELGQEILQSLQGIEAAQKKQSCHMCGMCCRMASSEYAYAELENRAAAGDEFARQFTSIFLPYASRAEAQHKAPEVVTAVLAEAADETDGIEKVFFYHCPYIGEDNRCTIYGSPKRPEICSRYPETPLAFVYEKCAWQSWKQEAHPHALKAHAQLAIAEAFIHQLKQALQA